MDILEQEAKQLAETLFDALHRLGELGREGKEAFVDYAKANRNIDFDEGLAQLEEANGELA